MKYLITPKQVIDLAFSSLDQITPGAIKETKIDAAQEAFLLPVIGVKLFNAFIDGKYAEFLEEYIHPALAYYVRYAMIPDLSLKLNNSGVQVPSPMHSNAATDKQRAEMRQQARDDAHVLLNKAVNYIMNNRERFPEYEPQENVRNRSYLAGGIFLKK